MTAIIINEAYRGMMLIMSGDPDVLQHRARWNASIAIVMLQPGCNMACDFCITEDNFSAMSFEQGVELLHYLKGRSFRSVVFGGGEPFAWKNGLVPLTQAAKRMGFIVQVGTNGIRLPDPFVRIPSIDRYVLPLESADAAIHNQMRFYQSRHHAIMLRRLEQLKNAHQEVTISTVVTRLNMSGLFSLGKFLKQFYGNSGLLHAWHLYQFVPEGRGGAIHGDRLVVTVAEYDRVCRQIKEAGLVFPIYKRKNMFQSKTADFFWHEGEQLQSVGAQYRSRFRFIAGGGETTVGKYQCISRPI